MKNFLRYSCLLPPFFLAPEGGGGGGGGDGGKPGGEGGGGDGGAQGYRPSGLTDEFFGGDDKSTIDKLWGGLQQANTRIEGFRTEVATRGTVPDKLDAYNFTLSEKAKPVIQIGDDDKLIAGVRQLAQKHKMPDKMFNGFMSEFFDQVVDLNLIEKPVDPNDIYKELGKGRGNDAEQITAGTQRLNQAQTFISAFTEKDGFTQPMKDELSLLTTSAAGVAVVEKLMSMGLKPSINPGGGDGGGAGGVTKEALQARQADPRNDRNSAKYDPAFAAETMKQYKQFYPGG
jgi:hypothetical protein